MMESIEKYFPEINDPEWIERREVCWQLAMEVGEYKKEYRKKELDKIKRYFFTGAYDNTMPFSEHVGTLIKMFPVQEESGYGYFYLSHDLNSDQLENLTRSALLDLSANGQDDAAQLAYWDYHLGESFQAEMIRHTKSGPVTIGLDPMKTVKSILGDIYGYLLIKGSSYSDKPKYIVRLDYCFSILTLVGDELVEPKKEEFFIELFISIIARKFKANRSKKTYRHIFAAEFEKRMEETEGLPPRFVALWERAKKESKASHV